MQVEVLAITTPRKASVLANAKVRLTFSEVGASGPSIIEIDDIRVLRNNRGELWIAMPTYSVPEGRGYRYEKVVETSKGLHRQIEDAVLGAFEAQKAVRP
jgi:DNA-binding cell septation regulator SpoVG